METNSHLDFLNKILDQGAIDRPALQAVYNHCIKDGRVEQARDLLNLLTAQFPNDRQVLNLSIALCIHEEEYPEAMRRIESVMARCTPEDGLIDAALAVRAKLGADRFTRPDSGHGKISLCMIVKDEMKGLGACLQCAKKIADEIIVVDTGSTDRTRDIARAFGSRLFEYQWHNDFAAARNFSLEKASGDWVLILDADEIIAAEDHASIRTMLNQSGRQKVAFKIETRNYTHLANVVGWHANDGGYQDYEAGSGWFPTRKVRLFPRTHAVRFRFPVHERIDPDVRQAGMQIVDCDIPVHHYGCLNESRNQKKAHLYLQLGYDKLDQFRDDLEALRELAVQAGQLEQWSKAAELWRRLIEIQPNYAESYVNLAGIYWQLGHYENAHAMAASAFKRDGSLKEARYNMAISLMFMGRAGEAIDIFRQLLTEQSDYLSARFMLSAALSFVGDTYQSAQELKTCRKALSDQAVSMAVDSLVEKLEKDGKEFKGRRFKEAAVISRREWPDGCRIDGYGRRP